MPINNPRGFVPVRHLHGRTSFQMTLRPTRGKNHQQLHIGDVVFLDASASKGIQRYHSPASAAAKPVLGVIGAVYDSNRRPTTFSQPTAGPRIAVSTDGFAGVYEDPDIIFAANASATATFQHVGNLVQVRVCAPNTAAGRSGMGIDIGTTVSGAGHPFKIFQISPLDGQLDEARVSGAANQDVEVICVHHQWRTANRRNQIEQLSSGASG